MVWRRRAGPGGTIGRVKPDDTRKGFEGKQISVDVERWGETERDPNLIVEKTLTDKAFLAASQWYGDVRFAQYATLPPSSAWVSSRVASGASGAV